MPALTSVRRLLRLQAGGQWFALDLADVAAIEAADALAEASWSGDLVGSMLHAGVEVNIHLLAPRLGLPTFAGKSRGAVAIVRTQRPAWGMLVDRVVAETHVQPELHPAPTACGGRGTLPFTGVAAFPGAHGVELAWLLDPDRLHPDDPPPRALRPAVKPSAETPPLPPAPAAGERRGQVLMYSLGEWRNRPVSAGLSYQQVLEVLPMPELTPAPFAPPHVRGICAWRGRIVAVVDLGLRLGLPAAESGREKLLVARATPEGHLIGLVVPSALGPLRLPAPHGRGAAEDANKPLLGAFELVDRTLWLPDLAAVAEAA